MMRRAIKTWLAGSPWVRALVVALLVASHGFVWRDGYQRADQSAEVDRLDLLAAQRLAAITHLQKQIDTNRAILRRANERAETAQQRNTELEARTDALTLEFSARAALCPVSPDDARRLRDIR